MLLYVAFFNCFLFLDLNAFQKETFQGDRHQEDAIYLFIFRWDVCLIAFRIRTLLVVQAECMLDIVDLCVGLDFGVAREL
jgi:hypothetical protein